MKRPSAPERGYDATWRKLRAIKLKRNPLCQWCLEHDVYIKATLVHHIHEVQYYPEERLSIDNLWSSCHSCHEQHHKRDKNRGCDESGTPVDPNHHWNITED